MNILLALPGEDPFVIQYEREYLYIHISRQGSPSNRRSILLARVNSPETMGIIEEREIYRVGMDKTCVWAPEIHALPNYPIHSNYPDVRGKWFIIFAAAGEDGSNRSHRMWVLRSESDDPFSPYAEIGRIIPSVDVWAIDGTYFPYKGKLYLIWSGWESDYPDGKEFPQCLYISEMETPWKTKGNRVLIGYPHLEWQCNPPLLEGPQIRRTKKGLIELWYSTCGSWEAGYQMSRMELLPEGNPLNPGDWKTLAHPILYSIASKQMFGPGHGCIVKTPKGEEWIVFGFYPDENMVGWDNRRVGRLPLTQLTEV